MEELLGYCKLFSGVSACWLVSIMLLCIGLKHQVINYLNSALILSSKGCSLEEMKELIFFCLVVFILYLGCLSSELKFPLKQQLLKMKELLLFLIVFWFHSTFQQKVLEQDSINSITGPLEKLTWVQVSEESPEFVIKLRWALERITLNTLLFKSHNDFTKLGSVRLS